MLRFDANLGFARANNEGIKLASAPLIFLLNNDAVVEPGTVPALLDAARHADSFGIFAPQMIRLSAQDRVDNRGLFIDLAGHCRQLDAGHVSGGRRLDQPAVHDSS